jgi:hypothetical protein
MFVKHSTEIPGNLSVLNICSSFFSVIKAERRNDDDK